MPRDSGMIRRAALAAIGLLAALSAPLLAAPDSPGQLRRAAVEQLAATVVADDTSQRTARALLSEAGFALPEASGLAPMPPKQGAKISTARFDLRIILAQLAQAFGHEDNSAVLAAQASRGTDVMMIESGSVRLSDLARLMGDDAVSGERILELRAPLILWHGAELRVSPGEMLQLSRTHGAFILNFGRLVIDQAQLRGVGGQNPDNEEFAPFVTTTGQGTMQIRGTRINDLGFGSTVKFSGLSFARSALDRPAAPSFVIDSVIQHVRRISVESAAGLTIDNNRILDADSAAIVILHSRDTSVTANIIAGRSVSNAIRVLDGAVNTYLGGNAILEGERVGILIKNAANGTVVEGNIVWGRKGSGIKVDRARCSLVARNLLIGNRQKGIEVRRSREALLAGNVLVGNKSAGIWVSGQPLGAVTRIEDNVLDANGSGLATATAAAIVLEGNDFSAQFPKFLAGDIAAHGRLVASDIKGRSAIALDASGPVNIADLAHQCDSGR